MRYNDMLQNIHQKACVVFWPVACLRQKLLAMLLHEAQMLNQVVGIQPAETLSHYC